MFQFAYAHRFLKITFSVDIFTDEMRLDINFVFFFFKFFVNISRESKVLKRVLECCALNGGVFYSSMVIFDAVLLPLLRILLTKMLGENSGIGLTVWSWMQPALSILFGTIWVMPLFFLSRIVNSLWFQVCRNVLP